MISWNEAAKKFKSNKFKSLNEAAQHRDTLKPYSSEWKDVQNEINQSFGVDSTFNTKNNLSGLLEFATQTIDKNNSAIQNTYIPEKKSVNKNNHIDNLIKLIGTIKSKAKNLAKKTWINALPMHERMFLENLLNINQNIDWTDFTKTEKKNIVDFAKKVATYRDSIQYEDYGSKNTWANIKEYTTQRNDPLFQIRNLIGTAKLSYENKKLRLQDTYDFNKYVLQENEKLNFGKIARILAEQLHSSNRKINLEM